mmetsp:Transcript_62988/g.119113  ORF Transcript_62988/g.119113 Transcript_62988/m.119113 type:complete len:913 (-) Transcript_62988:169-2907(-)
MPEVEIDTLQVVLSVSVPQLNVEKTTLLNGFESEDIASEVVEAFVEWCVGIRREYNLRKPMDDSDARTAREVKATVLERSAQWQKQVRDLEQEKTQLQIRYDRNVQSMAEIRTRYLKEIESLREKIYRLQNHGLTDDNRNVEWVPPKLCCLHPADCVTPADISLPLEEAVASIKARMEEDWNRSAYELRQETEGLRSHLEVTNSLLQRKDLQLAQQAKLLESMPSSAEKVEKSTNTESLGDMRTGGSDRTTWGSQRGSWPFRSKSRGDRASPRSSTEGSDSTNSARWRGVVTPSSQAPGHDLDRVRVNTALKPAASVTSRVWRLLGRGSRRAASESGVAAVTTVSPAKRDSSPLTKSSSLGKSHDPTSLLSATLLSDEPQSRTLSVSASQFTKSPSRTPENSMVAEVRNSSKKDTSDPTVSGPAGLPRIQQASLNAALDITRSPSQVSSAKATTPTIQKVHCRRDSLQTPVGSSLSGATTPPTASASLNSFMMKPAKSSAVGNEEADQVPALPGGVDGTELTPTTRGMKRRITIPRLDLDARVLRASIVANASEDSDSGDSDASQKKEVGRRNSGRGRAGTAPAHITASAISSLKDGDGDTAGTRERPSADGLASIQGLPPPPTGASIRGLSPAPVGSGLGASATSKLRGRAVLGSPTSCGTVEEHTFEMARQDSSGVATADPGEDAMVRRTSRSSTAPAMPAASDQVEAALTGKAALEVAEAVVAGRGPFIRSERRCTTLGGGQKPLRKADSLTPYQMSFPGPTIIGEAHLNKTAIASATPSAPLSAALRSRANRQSILVKAEDRGEIGPLAQLLNSVAATADGPSSGSAASTCAEEQVKELHAKCEGSSQAPASPRQPTPRQTGAPKCRMGRRATTFTVGSDLAKSSPQQQQQRGLTRAFTLNCAGVKGK